MTENEAIKRLQTLNIILTNKAGHEEDGFEKIFTFSDITAICTAIQALEEIQEYRAIGTVKGYERAIEVSKENYYLCREYKALLREYEAIGTIEEFKALKEKSVAKKPIRKKGMCYSKTKDGREGYDIIEECPTCKERLYAVCFNVGYCSCGQRIMP